MYSSEFGGWLPSWFINVQVSFCSSEDWLVTASGREESLRNERDWLFLCVPTWTRSWRIRTQQLNPVTSSRVSENSFRTEILHIASFCHYILNSQPGFSAASPVLSCEFFRWSWNWFLGLQGVFTRHDFHRMPRRKSAYGNCSVSLSCQDGCLFWEAFSVFAEPVPAVSFGRTF